MIKDNSYDRKKMPGERNLGRHKLDWSEKAEVTFTLFPSLEKKLQKIKTE